MESKWKELYDTLNRQIHPEAEIQLPSEKKTHTQRITWICFIRSVMRIPDAHIWVSLFPPLAYRLVSRDPDRTDAKKEKGNLEERKKAPRLRWTISVPRPGGRLLELGDESERGTLIYCTVHCCRRWIANPPPPSPLSFLFFCLSPPCP